MAQSLDESTQTRMGEGLAVMQTPYQWDAPPAVARIAQAQIPFLTVTGGWSESMAAIADALATAARRNPRRARDGAPLPAIPPRLQPDRRFFAAGARGRRMMVEYSAMPEPARTKTGVARLATETQSLVDRVSHEVRRSIIEGRVPSRRGAVDQRPGIRSRRQPEPVREALQRLAGQGLVLLRPARTAVIAPLEVGDLEEIYRLRLLIEVDAVVRAMPLLTRADLKEMEAHLGVARVAALDTTAFWEAHDAFHRVLLAPVLTARLDQLITQLWQSAQRYIRLVYIETDALSERNAVERHVPLIEAARSGDPDRMRAVYSDHLTTNEADIRQYLEGMLESR